MNKKSFYYILSISLIIGFFYFGSTSNHYKRYLHKQNLENSPYKQTKSLEKLALTDDYFIKRKLYPNVDFYSGIIYRALGIPTQMFTVMFALGRLPGWIAQWWEMRKNNEPIGRPRQIFTGKTDLKFIPINKR